MAITFERLLLKMLSEITSSLREVNIDNRFDFDDIRRKYKEAIFKVNSLNKNIESNILSSNLSSDNLRQFYKEHACCWTNYVGCDSFSEKEKKQIFFSSILMEVDDEKKNKELLEINDKIFTIYNQMLNKNIPADIWVQFFFQRREKIKEYLKNCEADDINDILETFDRIQKYGLVIPIDSNESISEQIEEDCKIMTLKINQGIKSVTVDKVRELLIDKRRCRSVLDEMVESLRIIYNCSETSSYLFEKILQLNKSLHPDVKYIYYLPADGADGTTGLVIYGAHRKLSYIEIKDLRLLGYNILFPYVSAYKSAWENQRVVKESIKSAVSAIMSRNMSHNLGSHYLYYTKVALDELADNNGNTGPYIRGAAKVLSYIQGRMDYLATIVSNDKYPYGSVNFKSQIIDELTIDDFSKRHYGLDSDSAFIDAIDDNILNVNSIKELADELLIRYNNIGSLNNKEFIQTRTQIDKTIEALHLQIRQIDKKSIYNRTTNYLLTNLIKSENYSRPDILDHTYNDPFRKIHLYIRLWNNETNNFDLFTGSSNPDEMIREKDIKDQLSKINLALPGGTMSCHAFYNIVENFIRNSAKYSWTDCRLEGDLIFTITLKIDNNTKIAECIIYDNKHDALKQRDDRHKRTLLEDIRSRLRHLRVLDENNMVDKENKGLKEMLFSVVWLRANESDNSFADIITKIENTNPRRKLSLISKYGFDFISVNDKGIICDSPFEANLGLRFALPLFTQVESLRGKSVKDLIKLHTDVIEVSDSNEIQHNVGRTNSKIFPRIFSTNSSDEILLQKISEMVEQNASTEECLNAYKLKMSIISNLGNIDDYILSFGSIKEPGSFRNFDTNHQIVFDTHFSTKTSKAKIKELYGKYVYVDTISGNNFTKTLEGLFGAGIGKRKRKYKSFNDMFLALKIKESALTRITIIDERLFNNVRWGDNIVEKLNDENISDDTRIDLRMTPVELTMKNVRVLNFLENPKLKKNICYERINELPFFCGNQFLQLGPCAKNPNTTHFLSIHLGLIEKLLKSKKLEKFIGPRGDNSLESSRIKKLMKLLETHFGYGIPNGVHICIHSGRGNFSKELEGPLKQYPFLSLAALESAFNNSKYLLAQLFYNTIFIGKGEINH